jgi:predicted transcriptional regulator
MPQMLRPELEHWYVVPFLRKTIVQFLKLKGLSQKDIAFLLGITPPAISQYLNNKRAILLEKQCPAASKKIKAIIDKRISQKQNEELNLFKLQAEVLRELEEKKIICEIHKAIDGFENCDAERE